MSIPDRGGHESTLGSVWETCTRLIRETAHVAGAIGAHYFFKWLGKLTGQSGEWWLHYLVDFSSLVVVVEFTAIFGAGAFAVCAAAVRLIKRSLRG